MKLLDLDPDSRDVLEFDRLLEWVASFARTPAAAERLAAFAPLSDVDRVTDELSAVEETRDYLVRQGRLLPDALPDCSAATQRLSVSGTGLGPLELRDLARVARAGADLGLALRALEHEERWMHLMQEGRQLPDLRRESAQILDAVDSEGRILDQASDELRRIRMARTRIANQLQEGLRRLLHAPDSEALIRDDFITQRNGRFVIPVRTDAPHPLPGIVHARSSSGATHFVEPMESVELNNDLVRLEEEENEEQQRILLAWTDGFRRRLEDLQRLLVALERIDMLQSRALFAEEVGACPTQVRRDGPLRLAAVRHPLLQRHLVEEGSHIVPLDLELDPADQVLVLSGPNTGGKTVALKTLGLSVLMAQSGIPVAAATAELPLYAQLRADIGDHQSIQSDLSTYSAHVQAVSRFLGRQVAPALFLFDEIGTGTEPGEGAALAQSILEHLCSPGMTSLATTHQGALKAWAFTTPGAVCAAMEFDAASLRPTFRILLGTAGASAGLDIAERLGLPAELVRRARELMDPDSLRGEGYLQRLRDLIAQREDETARLQHQQSELEKRRIELESAAERERARGSEEAARCLDQALAEWKRSADTALEATLDRHLRERIARDLNRAERRLRSEQAKHRSRLGIDSEPQRLEPLNRPPATGMRVHVTSLDRDGVVREVRGEQVEVQFGDVVFSVRPGDLRQPGSPVRQAVERSAVHAGANLEGRATPRELRLIGVKIEPALEQLDRYLDAAVVAGHDEVRVIHGHGTGRLRKAVRQFLDSHAQVAGFRAGGAGEGGEGATVVRLGD